MVIDLCKGRCIYPALVEIDSLGEFALSKKHKGKTHFFIPLCELTYFDQVNDGLLNLIDASLYLYKKSLISVA